MIGNEIEEDELQQEQGWGIGSRRRRAGAARLHLQEMDLPPLPRQLLHRPALHQQVTQRLLWLQIPACLRLQFEIPSVLELLASLSWPWLEIPGI